MPRIEYPRHFYKYRSMADDTQRGYVEDILVNNRLFWPSPAQFNDPFDCFPVATIAKEAPARRRYARRLIRNNMADAPKFARKAAMKDMISSNLARAEAELPRIYRERVSRIGVCSLAEDPDNILMWSHYADAHRGICFRFDPTRFDGDFFHADKVDYSAERPVVDMTNEDMAEFGRNTLLMKADYWAYEKEWRLIDVNGPGLHPFRPGLLDAVILGAAISEENRMMVTQWAGRRQAKTRIYQAAFDDNDFRLRLDEIG